MNKYRRLKRDTEVYELYKKGIDAKIISLQFGITRRTVYYIIKKMEAQV